MCIHCASRCPNACCEDIGVSVSSVSICPNACSEDIGVSVSSVSSCSNTCSEDISISVSNVFLVVLMLVVRISVYVYLLCF